MTDKKDTNEALTFAQRRARAIQFKRLAPRIKQARKRAAGS